MDRKRKNEDNDSSLNKKNKCTNQMNYEVNLYNREMIENKSNYDVLARIFVESLLEELIFLNIKANKYIGGQQEFEANIMKGISLLENASHFGEINSIFQLGLFYFEGVIITKDLYKAATYFAKGADLGCCKCMYYIGKMYRKGLGIEKNSDRALAYISKAADGGDENGTYVLGKLYEKGENVKRNINKAIELYKRAAKHKHLKAKAKLRTKFNIYEFGSDESDESDE